MAGAASFSLNVQVGELPELANLDDATEGRRLVEHLVCAIGLATACMSVALAIYKAPAGVFDGHAGAYYASVVSAGVVGLAEACTAVVWLSAGADGPRQGQQQRILRRCVLCASLLPLAVMSGLGGVRMLVK
ncbi:hypothetical protein CFC21_081283 [Triticum aestivum]|uniref:Uncharacterized protein n=2 Tax=Triticum aestivum TaxID=4565 RepID=A0A3B6N387_WHEAT|nr:hypothetical protein CFC21_081283 [Triticum aestivum]